MAPLISTAITNHENQKGREIITHTCSASIIHRASWKQVTMFKILHVCLKVFSDKKESAFIIFLYCLRNYSGICIHEFHC